MKESAVMSKLRHYFLDSGYQIFQYHTPGGHAAFNFNIKNEVFYPDLVSLQLEKGDVYIVEAKGSFDLGDIEKLKKYKSSEEAVKQLRNFISKQCDARKLKTPSNLRYFWAHAFSGKFTPLSEKSITLICVQDNLTFINNKAEMNE